MYNNRISYRISYALLYLSSTGAPNSLNVLRRGKRNVLSHFPSFYIKMLYPRTPNKPMLPVNCTWCTRLSYIPGHPHKNRLRSQLKGPEANFLEATLACLLINNIVSKCIVYLLIWQISNRNSDKQERDNLQLPRDHP